MKAAGGPGHRCAEAEVGFGDDGQWPADTYLTLIEFPGVPEARGFYDSGEYGPLAAGRRQRTDSTILLVPGPEDLAAAPRPAAAGYVFGDIAVREPELMREYRSRVPATIEAGGGRSLFRAGEWTRLEGEWEPTRVICIEFASVEQADRWYGSAAYGALIPLRQRAADADIVLAAGV